MKRVAQALARYFFRGLLVVAPVAATIYVVWLLFDLVDGWINVDWLLDRRIPGVGAALTLVLVTAVGFLASNFATRWLFGATDRLFSRVPLVKLLYTAIKDLIGAFVGERRRFDRPVALSLGSGEEAAVVGFLTRDDLAALGLAGFVAVYVPQSYNFAGNLLVVPAARVRPLAIDSTEAMTFVVSGGISGFGGAGDELAPPQAGGSTTSRPSVGSER